MFEHIIHRLAAAALVLLAVSFVTYLMLNAAPGDLALTLVGDSASAEQLTALRQELGLDEPVVVRYLRYVAGIVLRGDLGRSMISDRPVSALILERLPLTLALALASIALSGLAGFVLGWLAVRHVGAFWDTALMALAALGAALPSFWIALLLIMAFALRLDWLPVVGADSPKHLILPAVTLSLPSAAVLARLVRSSLLDVIGADFVRTAYAKGLVRSQVMWRHVLRNAAIPIVTLLALQLGYLLGGAFIVETIFAWPGLGRLTVQAIFDRDYPVVLGATLMIAAVYIALNLIADLCQAWLDPRTGANAL
jgi:ABC-type dipeptide/oligopeptide/nickel transport system permease component